MSAANGRVQSRQWKVLRALIDAREGTLTVRQARDVLGSGAERHKSRGVVEGLLAHGLLEHSCDDPSHPVGMDCRVTITPRGEAARADKRAIAAELAGR